MRILVLSLVVVAGAACGTSANKTNQDPNAPADMPAVVSAPLKLPIDTMKKEGTAPSVATLIPTDQRQRQVILAQQYSLATAMMVNLDARMLAQLYADDATLHTPDTTVKGKGAVAQELVALARGKSLADFQRTSRTMTTLDDSTLSDSGSYLMVLKRTPKDSVIEHGSYATRWRARKGVDAWVMLEDQLVSRGKGAAKKAGK